MLFKTKVFPFNFSITLIVLFTLFESCTQKSNLEGEKLAKTYCSSCHQLPEPDVLPKNVWKHSTLPYMGILMGIKKEIETIKEPLAAYKIFQAENQMISDSDWEKIKKYYLDSAPEKLAFPKENELNESTGIFETEIFLRTNRFNYV